MAHHHFKMPSLLYVKDFKVNCPHPGQVHPVCLSIPGQQLLLEGVSRTFLEKEDLISQAALWSVTASYALNTSSGSIVVS